MTNFQISRGWNFRGGGKLGAAEGGRKKKPMVEMFHYGLNLQFKIHLLEIYHFFATFHVLKVVKTYLDGVSTPRYGTVNKRDYSSEFHTGFCCILFENEACILCEISEIGNIRILNLSKRP